MISEIGFEITPKGLGARKKCVSTNPYPPVLPAAPVSPGPKLPQLPDYPGHHPEARGPDEDREDFFVNFPPGLQQHADSQPGAHPAAGQVPGYPAPAELAALV